MEQGLALNYKEKFDEQKQIFKNYDKKLIESLEQKLDTIKFEEIPQKYEIAHSIKDKELEYKRELDEIRLRREQGLKENPDDNLVEDDEDDEFIIQKEKQKKKKLRDEKLKKLEEEYKKKKNNLNNEIETFKEDYLSDDEDDYDSYEIFTEEDYEEDENYYENEEEYNKEKKKKDLVTEEELSNELDTNKLNDDEEKKEINLELEVDKFILDEEDFINIPDLIDELVDELYSLEKEKKKELIKIEYKNNLYFSEYGSKYQNLILTNKTDFINIQDKDLYNFFSLYIKEEQIIEIFEWIL